MRPEQLNPCPFCGAKPVRNDDISATGFVGSKEEDQIYFVACMTKGCQPEGVFLSDVSWNIFSAKQDTLMKAVFDMLEAEGSPLLEEKKKRFRLYVMSH
ncbi:hypothetical protein [Atlantibacter hermannii]|uniref:hypothetical protein n=1 Tax=Atlantibacter hermannii TaxID=565 RepID=UPI0028A7CB4B|nr:hypothetical protein [Atlantibacter hermannii]